VRVLLASYDAIADGPGRSQTIPYLRGLAARGHAMAAMSFERPDVLDDPARVAEVESALGGATWTRVRWRRSPPRDLVYGLSSMRRAVRAHRAELVHARGYVPAFLAQRLSLPFLFDMRGFWPDERADGGLWTRKSLGFRLWKRIEKSLLRDARAVVVLTERARDEIARLRLVPPTTPVRVIPTCTDLARFRPVPECERAPECRGARARYLVLGATGTWYLREETLDLAARALVRDPGALLQILTLDDPEPLVRGLALRGVAPGAYAVRAVAPPEVPRWISGARAAIVLLRSAWSKGASCPTKLGELFGCGVPVLMTAGVGDADRILNGDQVGVTVTGFGADALDASLDALDRLHAKGDGALARRCRAVAEREFDLAEGVRRYAAVYAEAAAR
jgi:glycosyltransferase involved in cell wall biosynthesis